MRNLSASVVSKVWVFAVMVVCEIALDSSCFLAIADGFLSIWHAL